VDKKYLCLYPRFEGFNMIAEDATFEKYRNKVLENIAKKEKVIK
jgi:hypothetical protein